MPASLGKGEQPIVRPVQVWSNGVGTGTDEDRIESIQVG